MTIAHESPWMNDDLRMFRKTVRLFIHESFAPHQARWREEHHPDAGAWVKSGAIGMLLPDVPQEFGGGGGTFAHEAIVLEELARAGVHFGSSVQSIVARYIHFYGNAEQKRAWLPRMARGEVVGAVAMTEPAAGSDLQGIRTVARREGDHYTINGSKTFITNGQQAGLVCLVVKTDPKATGPRGLSIILVETGGLAGYRVGRPSRRWADMARTSVSSTSRMCVFPYRICSVPLKARVSSK